MRLSDRTFVFRLVALLLVGVVLGGLTAGCELARGEPTDPILGQSDLDAEGVDNLPPYRGYETGTPLPTATPEPLERQFEVTDIATYEDANGNIVFLGRVENTASAPLDYAVVRVDLLDETGAVVVSGAGYTLLDVTFPGKVNAFRVEIPAEGVAWVDFNVEVKADSYLGDYLNPDINFSIAAAGGAEGGGFELSGEVANQGEAIAQEVYLLVFLYDQQLKLWDVDAVPTDLGVIPVGGVSTFTYRWQRGDAQQVGRYEVFLQGYR